MKNISITGIFHHPYCSISPGIARASGSIAYGNCVTHQNNLKVLIKTREKGTEKMRKWKSSESTRSKQKLCLY
ncbi:unnamed protein product [Rhizopus microsporus]